MSAGGRDGNDPVSAPLLWCCQWAACSSECYGPPWSTFPVSSATTSRAKLPLNLCRIFTMKNALVISISLGCPKKQN